MGHNLGLALVQLGVQHVMLDSAHLEHAAQQLRHLDRRGAHKHRTALAHQLDNFFDDGVVFFLGRLVDQVVIVFSDYRLVGRDDDDVEFVDVPKLAGLGLGRTGHARQLAVHSEVVLKRDGGVGLGGGLDLDVFLGFDGLVQTVGISAAFHYTAGLFVDDFHFVVNHHIFDVLLEQRVCLQQLVDRVDALALDSIVLQQLVLLLELFLVSETRFFERRYFGADIGQHKELRVFRRAGQGVYTLLCQLDGVVLFVNHKVERIGHDVHVAIVLLHIEVLGLEHLRLDAGLAQELDERPVLGQTLVRPVEQQRALFAFLRIF